MVEFSEKNMQLHYDYFYGLNCQYVHYYQYTERIARNMDINWPYLHQFPFASNVVVVMLRVHRDRKHHVLWYFIDVKLHHSSELWSNFLCVKNINNHKNFHFHFLSLYFTSYRQLYLILHISPINHTNNMYSFILALLLSFVLQVINGQESGLLLIYELLILYIFT